MGASGAPNPLGRSVSGGPERTGFLERSGREEPPLAAGKKAGSDGFGSDGDARRFRVFEQGMIWAEATRDGMNRGRRHPQAGGFKRHGGIRGRAPTCHAEPGQVDRPPADGHETRRRSC